MHCSCCCTRAGHNCKVCELQAREGWSVCEGVWHWTVLGLVVGVSLRLESHSKGFISGGQAEALRISSRYTRSTS